MAKPPSMTPEAIRKREERARGPEISCYPVPTTRRAVETLMNLGLLSEVDSHDRKKVGAALGCIVAEWDQRWWDHIVTRDN